jgi:CMP-N-acetylneuraminic acid synthetase
LKSVSVVINARTQSTRVPRKLVRPFGGTTLLEIALAKLDRMDFFDNRYLAVAEDELAELGGTYPNVEVLRRDSAAVLKGVNPQAVTFAHYLRIPSDHVFAFNPCQPCVTVKTIRRAYEYFQVTDHLAYAAAVPTGDWVFDPDGRPVTNTDPKNLTTDVDRRFRKATHAFYIVDKRRYRDRGYMWTFTKDDPHLIEMPEDEAVDVDTELDFQIAEMIWRQRFGSSSGASTHREVGS